ncbi:hypothetical protein QFZ80_005128 [Paenibacillus sp. V4I7]|nr:hypothetical protein [Paenibacillus sp. V4I7]
MFHWIINRVTSELCLNYFYQWLEIAKEGSEQIRVPNWNQVRIMIEKSLPNFIFKHNANVGLKQTIQLIAKKEIRTIKFNDFICVTSSKNMESITK